LPFTSIADEDEVGVLDVLFGLIEARRPKGDFVCELELLCAVGAGDFERRATRVHSDRGGRYVLEEAAVVAWLQANARHLGRDPIGGGFAIRRAGATPFERVVRDRFHAPHEVVARDRRRCLGMSDRRSRSA
jgi:hypothetical protein